MRGERAPYGLEGVQVAVCRRGSAVGPFPDLADDRRVAREDLLRQEAPEEPRAVLEATGAGVERDARPGERAAAEVVDPVDDIRVDLALHPHGRPLHERVVLEPVVGELHRVEELVRRGHLEVLERRLADPVLALAVVVVEHAVGRDSPGGAELVGVRVVARAVAEEPDAADVGDVDVQLGPAAVVQRRRAVVERLAVAEPSRLRVPHVVEHRDRVVDLVGDPVRRVGVRRRRRVAVRRVVVPVEAERPTAALAEARGDRVEVPARLAEEGGSAVGAGENRLRLGVLGAGEEPRPGEKVAEDEGGGVRIRGGDVAELGADAAQSEERPGALERVLRLGQPALLERTRESVVLGRRERRERPRSRRRGRGSRPRAGGEQEGKCELGEAHWLCRVPDPVTAMQDSSCHIGVLLRPR